MTRETSLLSELLSGGASLSQYVGAALVIAAAIAGLVWHLADARKTARARQRRASDYRPCATCFQEKGEIHYRAPECPYCIECEQWFARPKDRRHGLRAVR